MSAEWGGCPGGWENVRGTGTVSEELGERPGNSESVRRAPEKRGRGLGGAVAEPRATPPLYCGAGGERPGGDAEAAARHPRREEHRQLAFGARLAAHVSDAELAAGGRRAPGRADQNGAAAERRRLRRQAQHHRARPVDVDRDLAAEGGGGERAADGVHLLHHPPAARRPAAGGVLALVGRAEAVVDRERRPLARVPRVEEEDEAGHLRVRLAGGARRRAQEGGGAVDPPVAHVPHPVQHDGAAEVRGVRVREVEPLVDPLYVLFGEQRVLRLVARGEHAEHVVQPRGRDLRQQRVLVPQQVEVAAVARRESPVPVRAPLPGAAAALRLVEREARDALRRDEDAVAVPVVDPPHVVRRVVVGVRRGHRDRVRLRVLVPPYRLCVGPDDMVPRAVQCGSKITSSSFHVPAGNEK
eukprot:gene10538-biopygen10665